MENDKSRQTIYERAEVGEKVIFELREFLKNKPVDVIGHLDSVALCCGVGTVAVVRVDLDQVKRPKGRTK